MLTISTNRNTRFRLQAGSDILTAALNAGVCFPHSCRNGRCGSCKCRVISGQSQLLSTEIGLSDEQRDAGFILSCVRAPKTDMMIHAEELPISLPEVKTLPCRISAIKRVTANIIKVTLRFPQQSKLDHIAGQYINVIGPNGIRRSYSIANACRPDKTVELHIRNYAGGEMSAYWFEQANVNDLLRINGPLGSFFLRNVASRDLLLLATGTGIAPVKAIIENLAMIVDAAALPKSISIFWGQRTQDEIYWSPEKLKIPTRLVPVLSRATDGWLGAHGHVQDIIDYSTFNPDNTSVYACGSPNMIEDARKKMLAWGLLDAEFYSDIFVPSSPN